MTAAGLALWTVAVLLGLFYLTGKEKRRVEECEGLVLLLRHLRTSVQAYALPRDKIYESFSHRALEGCGFLSVLRREGLSAALERSGLSLREEVLRPLVIFASGEGGRLTEEELTACGIALTAVEQSLTELKKGLPERLRLCRTLVLTGGMMVAILLL